MAWRLHILLALLAALCKPAIVHAQFLGGNGDGIAILTLPSPDPCPYFFGDTADGHVSVFLPNPDPCGYFEGSSADGATSTLLPNPDSCGFFEGSQSDGFASGDYINPNACPTFRGSANDGFAFAELVCAPLAVTASELEGRLEETDGYLWWYTFMEINNLGFSLQRSDNRLEWNEIAFLPGLDQSQQVRKYEHLDRNIPFGVSYYRWMQMDVDGSTSFSNVVTLVRDENGANILFQVYPVPLASGEVLRIRFENGKAASLRLRLTDMYGRIVREWGQMDFTGKLVTEMKTLDLTAGAYVLTVEQEGRRWVKRVVVY